MDEEIRNHPVFGDRVFSFDGIGGWADLGTAVLMAAGWRPDCARAVAQRVERLPPPRMQAFKPLLVGAIGANEWMPIEEQHWIAEQEQKKGAALLVEANTWSYRGTFATIPYLREMSSTWNI